MINQARYHGKLPDMQEVVIGIDPAVTGNEKSDMTGIIAAGKSSDGRFFILADASVKASPLQWSLQVNKLYEFFQADRVVGEVNQGGDLIETVLRQTAPHIPFKAVRASRGKFMRAEPIAALYEQNKVFHAGNYPELEDQMLNYTPNSTKSPDRLDAMVWALTYLAEKNHLPRLITA